MIWIMLLGAAVALFLLPWIVVYTEGAIIVIVDFVVKFFVRRP